MNVKVLAIILLFLSSIIWGGGFVAVKNCTLYLSSSYIIFLRFSIASLLLFFIYYKRLINTDLFSIIKGFILGTFLFLAFWLQTEGIKFTTPGRNAFFTSTNVIIVPFLYWPLSNKKPSLIHIISAFISLLGVLLLFYNGERWNINTGDILSLFCALFFALHIIYTKKFVSTIDPISLTFYQFLSISLLSLFTIILYKESLSIIIDKTFIISLTYISLLSTFIAYIFQTLSQKYLHPSVVSIILSTESVFGYFFSHIILGEEITVNTILGGLLIFISVMIASSKEL